MKFNDFNWEDIIYEAPNEPEEADDGLSATDYSDESNLEVDDVSAEEDLGAEDYTEMENEEGDEPADEEGGEEMPEDQDLMAEGEEGEMGEDGLEGEGEEGMEDDSLDDEQQDNAENDPQSQQNKYLAHDFIE